jgi:PIN domain nuclease of toxin-antitoxin system
MLIAAAMAEGWPVVTSDRQIAACPVYFVW